MKNHTLEEDIRATSYTLSAGYTDQSRRDRNTIISELNSRDKAKARYRAWMIIKNLVNNSQKGKYLSAVGYDSIMENWRTILAYGYEISDINDREIAIAQAYMQRERDRIAYLREHIPIAEEIEKPESINETEPVLAGVAPPEPGDHIPEGFTNPTPEPEKRPGFLSRTISRFSRWRSKRQRAYAA